MRMVKVTKLAHLRSQTADKRVKDKTESED